MFDQAIYALGSNINVDNVPGVLDSDDLPCARVERRALIDFAVDRLEHKGCQLRSHVAQGSFDLFGSLVENLTDLLCAVSATLRIRLQCFLLSPVALS